MESTLNPTQARALESLSSQQANGWTINKYGDIATGLNTTVLRVPR